MVKKLKPVTNGTRGAVLPSFKEVTKKKNAPLKKLLLKKVRSSGRNNKGHITARSRGGGHKQRYRMIDFKRRKDGIPAKVLSIEYDPNRTAHIALLSYADGEKLYILAPKGLKEGDKVMSGESAPLKVGCALPLTKMPLGSTIHNIEMYPGRGGQLIRSAGGAAQLMARSAGYATLKMPSGEVRMVPENCKATMGSVSNEENALVRTGKAGRARWQNKRPKSRATVRNPVDHPMGGGEGRQNDYHPVSPKGIPAKGFKTRSRKKSRRLIVKDRRKK